MALLCGFFCLAAGAQAQVAPEDLLVGEQLIDLNDVVVGGSGATRPVALFANGRAALERGQYGTAQADFSALVQKFPKHKLAGQAHYWLGETYYVRGDYKRAAQIFLDGYTKFSQNPKAPDSLLKLAMSLHLLGVHESACHAFADLAAQYPKAELMVRRRAKIERQRAGCS